MGPPGEIRPCAYKTPTPRRLATTCAALARCWFTNTRLVLSYIANSGVVNNVIAIVPKICYSILQNNNLDHINRIKPKL